MSTEALDIAPERDRIQPVQDVEAWSENLVLQVNDSSAGIAVWAHWSRIPEQPGVWESVLTCYLPNGELLTHRGFGPSPHPDTASSGPAGFRCVEPLKRWRLSFNGMARRVTTHDVTTGVVADGPVEKLEIALEFDGVHPTWNAGHRVKNAVWATAHLEQGGRITGHVTHRGGTTAIDGHGFRDHSYGPRDYSKMRGNTWVSAVTPSGRVALLLNVWPENGPVTPMGFIYDGHAMHDATHIDLPPMQAPDGSPNDSTVTITTAAGTEQLTVRATHRMNYTFDTPVGMILGSIGTHRTLVTESPAQIDWNGEQIDGWYEKSYRIGPTNH